MDKYFKFAASIQNVGIHMARIGLVVVLLWIGGLKAFRYEAVGIDWAMPNLDFPI